MTRFRSPLLFLSLLLLTFNLSVAAQQGGASLAGIVRDDTGGVIPGVTVTATRSGEAAAPEIAVTGVEGDFRINNLRPGTYRIEAVLDGFQPAVREVKLTTGQSLEVEFKIVPAFGETVDVVADAVQTGEVAILESRRQAAVVSDSISSEEIRKTPDSSAASVVERLTGVTLLGNKYVYVRGLGERYGGSTINGATLPTTETEKRVVPLDLFPAKLLETVNVVKTYTPDKSGEFGSGIVEMTTTDFPRSRSVKLTVGGTYHSGATGDEFLRYSGGLDWLGRGGQALPSTIPTEPLRRGSIFDPEGYTAAELEQFGESLLGPWTGSRINSASPATNFALTYGETFGRLGVVVSGVSNHSYDRTDEEIRFFAIDSGDTLVPRNDYDIETDSETATAGFVGNFGFRINDSNNVSLSSVITRDASSEARFQEGLNTNSSGNIRDLRSRYQLEQVRSHRLRGDHNLGGPGIGSLLEWNVSRSEASNESNLRENFYVERDPGVFELLTGAAESARLDFFDLEDKIWQGGAAYSIFFASENGQRSGAIKAGYEHIDRTRDFAARRLRFTTQTRPNVDLTQAPEDILTPETIGPNGFEIREVTGVNDSYDAEHTIVSAYLMSDATFARWRFVGGVRFEDSAQIVSTFNPFDLATAAESINESKDVLPSMNVVYQATPRSNLRFAYGRSLNRPAFRELSPFTFVEITGGRSVAGNPDLKQATLDGFDLRWELFPSDGEVLAASAFYKKIDSPIERIIVPTTELRTSFVNADQAELWGVELEFRRSLGLFTPLLERFALNVNYAYINSEVTLGEQQMSVATSTSRPLEGQSDQVGNVAIQFYEPRWGTMVRVLAAYVGERITDVGAYGLPDIYQDAYSTIDFVFSQQIFRENVELKLTASNLLDEVRQFSQGDKIHRRLEPGRSFGLSLSYTPF